MSAASRASMDIDNMRSVDAEADADRRTNTLTESMRATAGPEAVAYYAARNPAINTEMTAQNIDMVNDGSGGFRRAESIEEVVAYGSARRARLSRAVKPGERHALTSVGHLPLSMCEPDGTTYHPIDQKTGLPKDGKDGRPRVVVERLRAKDHGEMVRYFEEYLNFTAELLPGGASAIIGYSINLDETRPHIQILMDPYEPDTRAKEPGRLKSGYSLAFGSHRKSQLVQQVDRETGSPVFDGDGEPVMVREGAAAKMTRYHQELKDHMLSAGFEIEAERDPVRHHRKLGLADYKEVAGDRASLTVARREFEEEQAELAEERRDLDQHEERVDHKGGIVDQRERELRGSWCEINESRKEIDGLLAEAQQARETAHAKGLAKARAEWAEGLPALRLGIREEIESEMAADRETARSEGLASARAEWSARLPALRAAIREEIVGEMEGDRERVRKAREDAEAARESAKALQQEVTTIRERLRVDREALDNSTEALKEWAELVEHKYRTLPERHRTQWMARAAKKYDDSYPALSEIIANGGNLAREDDETTYTTKYGK